MRLDALRGTLLHLPPETAHAVALRALDLLAALGRAGRLGGSTPDCPRDVLGLRFANPVGLAAGLDKNADHVDALGGLGFGFIEIGTVTPRAQPGNPRPRLFRIPEHEALINRLGFNNRGVDHAVGRLECRRYAGVVGVNIGKNRDTPLAGAVDDYRHCLERVHHVADYVTLNVSSPNTPGLRDLQQGRAFGELLAPLRHAADRLDAAAGRRVPLLVKVAPDLDAGERAAVAAAVERHGLDGLIATNTTSDHAAVAGARHAGEAGGLSGRPLAAPSTAVLADLAGHLGARLPLVGVGGITDAESGRRKFDAGADLIQIYTGLIYRGPALVGELIEAARGVPGDAGGAGAAAAGPGAHPQ